MFEPIASRAFLPLLVLSCDGASAPADGPTDPATDAATDASAPAAGDQVFDESIVHEIALTLAPADWEMIIDAAAAYVNDNSEYPYFPAEASFDGELLQGEVGVRLKGHISIDLAIGHGFPLKLDFNRHEDGQTLDGLKKLNLHTNFAGPPQTILRDHLSYGAWRLHGVAAPRTSFAEVTVNDEALGLYVMVEQVDGDFIERHFTAPFGALYKPEQLSGTLEYRGPEISDYPDIGLKWPDESDHAALLHALEVLSSGSMDDIEQVIDVDGVLQYLAGNVALGASDYYANTGHNYYLYEATPGRFTMLPWDMNGSQERMGLSVCSPTSGYLSGLLLGDPDHLATYFDTLSGFLGDTASAEWLTARLDAAAGLLEPAISAQDVEGLAEDIAARTARLDDELATTTTCP